MPEEVVPHGGAAPEPKRKVQGVPLHPVEPDDRAEGRSPEEPQQAAQELDLRQQIGQMAQTIGQLKRQLEEQQREFELRMRLARQQAPQAQQPPQPPPDIDPEKPVTVGEFIEAMKTVSATVRAEAAAEALRATIPNWDSVAEKVVERYPEAKSLGEPDRTRFVLDAARRMGLLDTTAPAPAPPANPVPQQPDNTVPLVESPTPRPEEPRADDRLGELMAEYDRIVREARSLPLGKQREAWDRAKDVYNQILKLQGMEPGAEFDVDWSQET